MLLTHSRRAARTAPDGSLVVLPSQDRSLWDQALIQEGQSLVRACLRRNMPGPYQVQAAISAVHSDAATAEDTDWVQIHQLYDQLIALSPTPLVELNRAVAVAEVDGPDAGLAVVDRLDLSHYYLFHATRADLLQRVGRFADAAEAYGAALDLATNPAEREFLEQRRIASAGG
jgi:RNA polymerase sigma-70 factor (ECF subfamily)